MLYAIGICIVAFMCLVLPIIVTMINIKNLVCKKKIKPNLVDALIFMLGPIYMIILYSILKPKYWSEQLYIGETIGDFGLHEPISREYIGAFILLTLVMMSGYLVLRFSKKALPPLMSVLCISAMYIGCIMSTLFIAQLFPNINTSSSLFIGDVFLMMLFPFNYIISSISLIKDTIKIENKLEEEQSKQSLIKIGHILKSSKSWPICALIMTIPLLGIMFMILILFGQQPDSYIKMFTDTSDWLFSNQISPPTVYYDDHYLCTVAAGGHKKLVKPQRLGKRHNHIIIVNRQLSIANAFEELISEKTPIFHRYLRKFYDRYGFPIAKHIKNPWTADIAYIIMKPLEWEFLIILYLFDVNPEQRISKQYLLDEFKY